MAQHQESWAKREFERPDHHEWVTVNAAALARVDTIIEIENMIRYPEPLRKPLEEKNDAQ